MCSQLALCFLQRHCAPSDLHSFPTRRSSDLTGAVFQMFNHGTITAMLFLIVGVIYDRAHTRGLNDFGGLMNQMPKYSGIDRKSTRLNYSHTVISYAVFCLKKKKRLAVV